MKLFVKNSILFFLNMFPKRVKWSIISLGLFQRNIRFDFLNIRKNILNDFSKVIVVGANDGISFDDLFFDIHPTKTTGIFIEPSQKYYSKLKNNLKDFKNLELLNIAISKEDSVLTLYQLNDSGLKKLPDWGNGIGSFIKDHLLKFDHITESDLFEDFVVGKPFSWLIESYKLNYIDYLQIDTEGYDAEIIKMIDFNTFYSDIIKFEKVNLSKSEIYDVCNLLKENGYHLVEMNEDIVAYSKRVNPIFY